MFIQQGSVDWRPSALSSTRSAAITSSICFFFLYYFFYSFVNFTLGAAAVSATLHSNINVQHLAYFMIKIGTIVSDE